MVREVDISSNQMQLEDIKLIESTWGGWDDDIDQYAFAKVINLNDLENYKNKNWKVIRLY